MFAEKHSPDPEPCICKEAVGFTNSSEVLRYVEHSRKLLASSPLGHSLRDHACCALANALLQASHQTCSVESLSEAIGLRREALELRPHGHPLRGHSLDVLATALVSQFKQSGDWGLIDESIYLYRLLLELRPLGHPLRNSTLESYEVAHTLHMTPFDDDDKRQQAIHYYRGIANANLEDDCLHDINLFYLASALHEQFDRDGYIALLSEAIDLYRKTLKFRRTGHPLRDTSLNALGIGLHDQFRQNGGKEKIHEAILLHQEALDLRPPGHPLRLTSLNNMGVIYSLLFKSDGNPDVLAKTIHTHTEQLSLCPPNHRLRVPGLCNLAIALHESFGLHGREEDLTKSIRLHREAVSLFPQGNPRRGIILNALSNALRDRFKLYRDLDSFSEAVSIQREVLALRPAGHPGRATSLHNLALTLLNSLEPSESNLSEITVYLEEAIGLYPPDITLHWDSHCYLACALSQLATIRKDNSVFLKAIELHRESVSSSHLDSPYRDDYFFQMGKTFWELYKFSGNQEDLTAAFRGHHEALQIRGMGHPRRVFSHHAISQILLNPRVHRIDEGLDHVESANLDPYCPARKRLELLLKIVPILESTASCENPINKQRTSRRVLEVYIQAIELLPQAAHLGMNLVSRLRELVGTEHLCRVAAIRALLLDKPAVAVEILEEGRTVLWAQSLCLRRTNDLQSLRDDERLTLSRLFHTLEHQSQIIPETSESKTELERRLDDLRRLNAEAQSMLRQIRSRPGFARFMKIESFEKLTNASQSGPVVFLVATDLACFAVVLTGWASPATVVRLDEVTPCLLQERRIRIRDSSQRDDSYDVREHDSSQDIEFDRLGCYKLTPGALSVETQVYRTLSKLWQAIVKPVIHALDLKKATGNARPRVHWCPVGDFAFLPLHAAGIYGRTDSVSASDFIVSSYAPSLSSVIKARQDFKPLQRDQLRALLIAVPAAVGRTPLPKAEYEVRQVEDLIHSTSVKSQTAISPDVHTVLDGLPNAHILHLACHGIQKENALDSHFLLADGPLSVATLAKLDLPNAVFAFLSTCEAAKGDKNQPDQAVHLAASLLFCGFRSIIGTMWSMRDEDGPRISKAVYERLLSQTELRLDDIPYALDEAVHALRASGAPPSRWATFIHMGA